MIINGRKIGQHSPPYIIAEMSGNHNGSLDRALATIKVAKEMGADAIKLQSYSPDTITMKCESEDFRVGEGLWRGQYLYDLYAWAQTPFAWHKKLFEYAREIDITCFSSPFDETAVDLLEDLNCPAYKIASFEAVDLPLIRYVARTGKPMIISTGIANEEEISEALEAARSNGAKEIALLHCISSYPAPADQSNLRTIPDISNRFNVLSGLSDHSHGTTVAIASVALGASIIEKHFTISRADKGPDSDFSLEPDELRRLCSEARIAWLALGQAGYEKKPAEVESAKYRRSIYVVEDMREGEIFSSKFVRSIRPGFGLKPKYYDEIIGKKAKTNIKRGTPLSWELIDE